MAYSAYNRRRFQGEKPVEEGQEYDITIEGVGSKGDGIGKIKGFVVIVPNTKQGDTVRIKVTAVRGKVAFGEVVGEAKGAPAEASEETEAESAEAPKEEAVEEKVEETQEEAAEEKPEEEQEKKTKEKKE